MGRTYGKKDGQSTVITPAIRARLDQHTTAAEALFFTTISGGIVEIKPDWTRSLSGVQIPSFNTFRPLNPAGLTDEILADTAAFFAAHETFYAVELMHDRLPNGPAMLNERHYQPLPPQPAMHLRHFPRCPAPTPEIYLERVRTVPALTAFYTLLQQVFDYAPSNLIKLFPALQLKTDAVRHYLVFFNEQPVGAGTLLCANRVVGISNLCTVDSYRQRGVAGMLLHYMLADAEQSGIDVAMLYASAQAYHFFQKFGFEMYTQRQWFLPPGINYEEEE
jgi:GNAT superfamily N-acetyltransferase